jgi:hydroxymethylglutaryl-CoA reductase (NADPH)
MKIPSLILKQMYTFGSLENADDGVHFSLKNRLADATLTHLAEVRINGRPVPLDRLTLAADGEPPLAASQIAPERAMAFPLRQVLRVHARVEALPRGTHEIALAFEAKPFGSLSFKLTDAIAEKAPQRTTVPYHKDDNHTAAIIAERQRFVESYTGVKLQHIDKFSFEPGVTQGNIENFTGVAQVPIGFAGPLHVNGEAAVGDFLIPLATTEGTLVASYNRGIKVLNLSGGVTTTPPRWWATPCSARRSSCSTMRARPATSPPGWTSAWPTSAPRPRPRRASPS